MSGFIQNWFKNELPFASKRIFIWLLVFTIVFFYILWQKSIRREQALKEEKLIYQYNNLKSYVNPHFLFNSLNTLTELVYEDAKKADSYINRLSDMYRYVLENEEKEFISLDKELEFVVNYVELQRSRNGDKIDLNVAVINAADYLVVPVSIQSLVENAIKHNISSKESPLTIKIWVEHGSVFIMNNLQRKNIMESSKSGLANLKQRVSLTLGKELNITESNTEFIVEMPLKKR
jgi:LytS/YehU family sensor histidine kinase